MKLFLELNDHVFVVEIVDMFLDERFAKFVEGGTVSISGFIIITF